VEALSAAAPDWLAQVIDVPGWSRRYGRRIDSWRMPASKTKQDALALDYARDGFALLGALYAPGQPGWLRELPAAQVLRTVLLQNYTRTTAPGGSATDEQRTKDRYQIRGVRSTAIKHAVNRLTVLRDTFTGKLWLPPAATAFT
jgi:hypothetical protein